MIISHFSSNFVKHELKCHVLNALTPCSNCVFAGRLGTRISNLKSFLKRVLQPNFIQEFEFCNFIQCTYCAKIKKKY